VATVVLYDFLCPDGANGLFPLVMIVLWRLPIKGVMNVITSLVAGLFVVILFNIFFFFFFFLFL